MVYVEHPCIYIFLILRPYCRSLYSNMKKLSYILRQRSSLSIFLNRIFLDIHIYIYGWYLLWERKKTSHCLHPFFIRLYPYSLPLLLTRRPRREDKYSRVRNDGRQLDLLTNIHVTNGDENLTSRSENIRLEYRVIFVTVPPCVD